MSAEGLDALDIADRLNHLRGFVECAALAAGNNAIDPQDGNALQTVLEHAVDGMRDLSEAICPRPPPIRTPRGSRRAARSSP